MRRISANYVFPITSLPIKNGIVELNDKNEIIRVIHPQGNFEMMPQLEFYNGVIVPGFVNAHCHLELSYLENKIERQIGLHGFISEIITRRQRYKKEKIQQAIKHADEVMWQNGIVAVGDISNLSVSFLTKLESKIDYYTFFEIFGINSTIAPKIFTEALKFLKHWENNPLKLAITPHAPYSVSPDLFQLIFNYVEKNKSIFSLHNQESEFENIFFEKKQGKLFELFKNKGHSMSDIEMTGQTSLQSIIPFLPKTTKTLLVHNIFTSEKDIDMAIRHNSDLTWVFCPKSNLYIENQLPNMDLFRRKKQAVALGTDSYASNNTLSILDELKTIQHYFPEIPFAELLQWATINGAKALKSDKKLGSLEAGKSPGILLIENFDFEHTKLKNESRIKRLVNC